MSDHHFWLSGAGFDRLRPLLPNQPCGVWWVDDRRVISGTIHVIRRGRTWRDAPAAYGPHNTLYNRFVCWSWEEVFGQLEDWRRIATRYDRCARTIFSAICIGATLICWLQVLSLAGPCSWVGPVKGESARRDQSPL